MPRRIAALTMAALMTLALAGTARAEVVFQPDGKILVGDGALLTRLLPNGKRDLRFGRKGSRTVPAGAGSIAVRPDGKILVGTPAAISPGNGKDPGITAWAVRQYKPSGRIDLTFGQDGTAFVGAGADYPDVAVQQDGKIVLAGSTQYFGAPISGLVARLNPDGSLDKGFGQDGSVRVGAPDDADHAGGYAFGSVVIAPDGTILAGGTSDFGSHSSVLARFLPDGEPDTTFGDAGVVDLSTPVESLALQPDGRILTAGNPYINLCLPLACPPFTAIAARYLQNGALDGSYGSGGQVQETGLGVNGAGLGRDGALTLGGLCDFGPCPPGLISVVRLEPNGARDPSFGHDGKIAPYPTKDFGLSDVSSSPGGRVAIELVGRRSGRVWIGMFRPDGRRANGFGSKGFAPA